MSLFERSEECKSRINMDEIQGKARLRGNTGEIIDKSEVTPQNGDELRGNTCEIIEKNPNEAVKDRNLAQQVEPVSYAWLEVGAAAGMTDLTTDTLDHALFLFARHLVTSCPDDQFMDMGHRYVPTWRARLHPEAWAIVEDHIRVRLKRLGWKKEAKQ